MLMQKQDDRLGPGNSDLHSKMQIEMIGNVFYNMLAAVGKKENDERLIQLSADVREMLYTRNFDDIVGKKVPHFKSGVLNLLKVADLGSEDQAKLIKLGFGDLLTNPSK
jgi:hypothetical protein